MEAETLYSLIPACYVRDLGGKYLVLIYPEKEPPYGLDVNESFAALFRWAKQQESFSGKALAQHLETEYGLSPEKALEEAQTTIQLWQENQLLTQK